MNFLCILFGSTLGVSFYAFLYLEIAKAPIEYLFSAALGILIAYAVIFLSTFLDKQLSWKEGTGIRLLVGIVLTSVLAFLPIFIVMKISGNGHGTSTWIKLGILLFTTSLLFNTIYFIFYSYQNYTSTQVHKIRYQRIQNQLQLQALKSQLSPHFLFNSMNALSALFYKDIVQAEDFIRSLASSFKYVLQHHKSTFVTISEELKFAEDYARMMKIRFGNHLHISTSLDQETLKSRIPPLTLQMLVENAIKHNYMDKEQGLEIVIKNWNGYLEVCNLKRSKDSVRHSTKVGLQNISDRYALLSKKPVGVEDSEFFKVKLPIIA